MSNANDSYETLDCCANSIYTCCAMIEMYFSDRPSDHPPHPSTGPFPNAGTKFMGQSCLQSEPESFDSFVNIVQVGASRGFHGSRRAN